MTAADFDVLYAVASDPGIWEQHPNRDRWQKEVFLTFFEGALQSGAAFKIVEKATGAVIGSTRFYDYNEAAGSIFIGYTFYARSCWGTGINPSVKALMLQYAFAFVNKVGLHVGADNIRSQVAVSRLGIEKTGAEEISYYGETPKLNFIYEIDKEAWATNKLNPAHAR